MKKAGKTVFFLTAALLITALTLTLAACGNEAEETESGGTTSVTKPATDTTGQKTILHYRR